VGAIELLSTAGRVALLFAGLLGPGALLLRALRLPFSLAGSFLGSAATLYAAVLLLAFTHVPIDLGTLTGVLALVSLGASWLATRQAGKSRASSPPPADPAARPFAFLADLGPWTALYAGFLLILLWRLATQPLNGGDIDFRWSWLAEQMLHSGTLDFYPPRSAADFTHYFWVESIPPGVASLHAWAYACAGAMREVWASAGGLLQLLALHDLVWRLAHHWSGTPAARRAVILAAATPLLNWSLLLGQETGLTAVALLGITLGIFLWHQSRATGWLGLAALAAMVGAGAREYGLVFPGHGLVLLLLLRAPRRAVLGFAAAALPLALAWPLRTWILTGNPFYSLDVAGWFPVDRFFIDWAATISLGSHHLLATPAAWREIVRYLLLCAPAAAFCWLALFFHMRRRAPETLGCAAGLALTFGLWYASVPYTGGGLFYSLRVLSPAFALGAAFGGHALAVADWGATYRRAADLVLGAVLLATLPVSLTLPHNPYHLRVAAWPDVGQRFVDESRQADDALARHLVALPDHARILSEGVSLPRSLASTGITVVPLWSPEVAWLFDHRLPPDEVARRWRQSGLRYVVMTHSPKQLEFLARRAVWLVPFFHIRREWQSDGYVVLEVTAPPREAR